MFQDKSSLVYCNNIAGLIKSMGLWCYEINFLLIYLAEVSKQFYIVGIVINLSILGTQSK